MFRIKLKIQKTIKSNFSYLFRMVGVHREYSVHLGADGIYIEGGGEVIYIDRANGQGKDIHVSKIYKIAEFTHPSYQQLPNEYRIESSRRT